MTIIVMGPRATEVQELRGSYLSRDMDLENEAIKQTQRERVLEHFRRWHRSKKIKVFSLPGAWWSFEQQVEDSGYWKECRFVAVERNHEVMRHGVTFMPGGSVKRVVEQIADVTYHGYESERARILCLYGSLLADLTVNDLGGKPKRINQWQERYYNWTATWWDFMSPLCDETLMCIRRTEQRVSPAVKQFPMSITLFPARELPAMTRAINALVPGGGRDKRAVFVEKWLNLDQSLFRCELRDVFHYTSAAGAPMLLVNTVLHRTGTEAKDVRRK